MYCLPEVPTVLIQGGCGFPGLDGGDKLVEFETVSLLLSIYYVMLLAWIYVRTSYEHVKIRASIFLSQKLASSQKYADRELLFLSLLDTFFCTWTGPHWAANAIGRQFLQNCGLHWEALHLFLGPRLAGHSRVFAAETVARRARRDGVQRSGHGRKVLGKLWIMSTVLFESWHLKVESAVLLFFCFLRILNLHLSYYFVSCFAFLFCSAFSCCPCFFQFIFVVHSFISPHFYVCRYDLVLHLVTAASGAEAFYTNANNTARRETADEARGLDSRILKVIGKAWERGSVNLRKKLCLSLSWPVSVLYPFTPSSTWIILCSQCSVGLYSLLYCFVCAWVILFSFSSLPRSLAACFLPCYPRTGPGSIPMSPCSTTPRTLTASASAPWRRCARVWRQQLRRLRNKGYEGQFKGMHARACLCLHTAHQQYFAIAEFYWPIAEVERTRVSVAPCDYLWCLSPAPCSTETILFEEFSWILCFNGPFVTAPGNSKTKGSRE